MQTQTPTCIFSRASAQVVHSSLFLMTGCSVHAEGVHRTRVCIVATLKVLFISASSVSVTHGGWTAARKQLKSIGRFNCVVTVVFCCVNAHLFWPRKGSKPAKFRDGQKVIRDHFWVVGGELQNFTGFFQSLLPTNQIFKTRCFQENVHEMCCTRHQSSRAFWSVIYFSEKRWHVPCHNGMPSCQSGSHLVKCTSFACQSTVNEKQKLLEIWTGK